MAGEIRAQMLRVAKGEWITFSFELLNDPSLVDYCLGDDGIGQQLVCNNRLFLVGGLCERYSNQDWRY